MHITSDECSHYKNSNTQTLCILIYYTHNIGTTFDEQINNENCHNKLKTNVINDTQEYFFVLVHSVGISLLRRRYQFYE